MSAVWQGLLAGLLCLAGALAAPPRVTQLAPVAADLLELTIEEREVVLGEQTPYVAQPGDQVSRGDHHRWVSRGGKVIGALAGPDEAILFTFDRVVGERLDLAWAMAPASYLLTSADDPAYAQPTPPTAIERKSKPTNLARIAGWQFDAPVRHRLYLRLPRPLSSGKTYRLELSGGRFEPLTLAWDWRRTRSEAVHVSQVGFRPDDPSKVGFLSCWLGSGGGLDYPAGLTWELLDQRTGEAVLRGRTTLSKAAGDLTEDNYKSNHNKTNVYLADFSALSTAGEYRLAVENVGCSAPFVVSPEAWRRAFVSSARGLYHHRSGIALGPPHTSYLRPRCFHPDDGVKVYHSTTPLLDTRNGLAEEGSNFDALLRGKTDQVVPNAWGGYMDAGDWDRRVQHLSVTRLLLELASMFPEGAAAVSLNIPESGGELPDVVDEALFNLDHYRRLQTPEGGVRGGVESAEHPRQGEASWQESLAVMAYAPGVWSSYVYAGAAARAAWWLECHRPAYPNPYRESALRAMAWAEQQRDPNRKYPHQVNDDRNLAALELYRLTGEAAWHELFLATTVFGDPGKVLYQWQSHEQRDAAWVYATVDRPVDATVRRNARAALLREADERLEQQARTGFRWTGDPWAPMLWGKLSRADFASVVRAHQLTGEARYLAGVVQACQLTAGANPENLCYTTGVGWRSPQNPLHVDSRISGQPAPEGITVFGPSDPVRDAGNFGQKLVKPFIYPEVATWPALEAWWDVFWYPSICEYTVQSSIGPNTYAWGYLALRP